ncbi:MAG: CopL family metal-binding regulatory protein [Xanthomonadales bacterium]|nr:CopL family metal-binding regulatory protein [Xanthomonadales bacterium]
MFLRSTWLRVLLSLALILNGSAFAMPSMHGGMSHVTSTYPAATLHDEAESQPSCHEMPIAAAANETDSEASTRLVDSLKGATPDCCEHGKCSCACSHALATIPSIAMLAIAKFRSSAVRVAERGCPSPLLPHLSRPPIV